MPAELDKANENLRAEDQQLRDTHWQRQSLAAVTLVQLGFGDEVWSLLEFTPNPSLRSFIIWASSRNTTTITAAICREIICPQ
ncbi:MAG: hypothetical protein P8M30_00505 [Planctomycetaceae bacterium]|jgi:hypothetical protein|nr:hypothetical protein [Planctomycetaceae bacterium]MDG2387774.1 hypothetical protein [Planctomycetaceae bacterium]